MSTCTAPTCPRPVRARGLCAAHYERQARAANLGRLPRLSLSEETMTALCVEADARGLSVDLVAAEVLEQWARSGLRNGA